MLTPQATYVDRVKQSAMLLLQNWQVFVLVPIIVGIAVYVVQSILMWVGVVSILTNLTSGQLTASSFIIPLVLAMIVPVVLAILGGSVSAVAPIKAVETLDHDQTPTIGGVIQFALGYIGRYLSVVWHVFTYIAMWPVLGIILSIVLMMLGDSMASIGGLLMTVSIIALFVLMIVRGPNAVFALYIAVAQNKSGKDSLTDSISLTKGRWGEVVINLVIYSLIAWLVGVIIGSIGGAIASSFGSPYVYTRGYTTYSYDYLSGYALVMGIFQAVQTGLLTGFVSIYLYLLWKMFATGPKPAATAPSA